MIFILSFLGGIAGAAILAFAAGLIGFALTGSGTSAEMEQAMAAAVIFAPIGGIAGLVLGVWLVLRSRGMASVGLVAGHTATLLLTIAVLGGGIAYLMQGPNDILRPSQAALQLEFEIIMPPRTVLPPELKSVEVRLQTDKNVVPAELLERMSRKEGERPVIGGNVELYFRTTHRLVRLQIPEQPHRLFKLALPASPPVSKTLSSWVHIDSIDDQNGADPRRAGPEDRFDIRYRVVDPTDTR